MNIPYPFRYNVNDDSFTLMPNRLPVPIHGHSALVLDKAPKWCDTKGKRPLSQEEVLRLTDKIFGTSGIISVR